MKKMLLGAFFGVFALAGIAVLPNYVSADGEGVGGDDWAKPKSNINLIGDGSQKLSGAEFISSIKRAINWVLGMLATVALAICVYGGFLMVTAAGDEKKYQRGIGVLKYAAIGLAIIGLSWMIVSVIFWFIGVIGNNNQTQSAGTTSINDANNGGDLSQAGNGAGGGNGGNGSAGAGK